jgi:hypothetical protein
MQLGRQYTFRKPAGFEHVFDCLGTRFGMIRASKRASARSFRYAHCQDGRQVVLGCQ